MRFRRWVSWVAIAGILLHAATIARHNAVMYRAIAVEVASPLRGFDPGAICHVDSEADDNGTAQGLPGQDKGGVSKPCPVCLGLASVHALPASEAPSLRVPQTVYIAGFVPQVLELAPAGRHSLPLTRGPPSLA